MINDLYCSYNKVLKDVKPEPFNAIKGTLCLISVDV